MTNERDEVQSYATRGMRLWATFNTRHGHRCGCLLCADTRKYLGMQPLTPVLARLPQRQERAS